MSFSANEKFNGLFERSPRSPFGVWKQITHHFYWEINHPPPWPPGLCIGPDVSRRVRAPYNRNSESSLRRDEKKKIAGYVDIVWKWRDWIPTWRTHHKSPHWGNQSPHLTNGWACGGGFFCVGTDIAVLHWEMNSQGPCMDPAHVCYRIPGSFSPLLILWLFNLASLFHTVS